MNGDAQFNERTRVTELRERFPGHSAHELAQALGIDVKCDEWTVAEGRVVILAECTLQPRAIVLNNAAIRRVVESAQTRPELTAGIDAGWFTEAGVTQVVLAHELWHVIAGQSSAPKVEAAAHEFVRELLDLPFDPQLYEQLLKTR